MANNAIYVGSLTDCTNPQPADKLVIVSDTNANVQNVSLTDFYSNSSNIVQTVEVLNITGNSTPANNTDIPTGVLDGGLWSDGTYIYYYNGTEIKRVTLNTF